MQFTLLSLHGEKKSVGFFLFVFFFYLFINDIYLKPFILLCFSPAETDQSTQELFTAKVPRTTELAKTTRGKAISLPLDSGFSFFV